MYLADKALRHYEGKAAFVVTSRQEVFSNSIEVEHLHSSQEEADTRLILHSLDATRRGATELHIHSPDTDVFVLAIHWYHQLCKNTYFVTGVGNKKRAIPLGPVAHALGPEKAAALPAFHAFSGADTTGRFAGKGKLTCWQALTRCSIEVTHAFSAMGTSEELEDEHLRAIEAYVCQLYDPRTTLDDVGELRWKLFTNKQLEARKLQPTRGALRQAISRAHYQAMVWHQADVPKSQIPPATDYGWREDGNRLVPIPTLDPPAPATITQLIRCGCKKSACQSRCSCRSQQLSCTEMCACGAEEDVCGNITKTVMGLDEDDEDDSDPSL